VLRADVALIGGTGTGDMLRSWGGRAVCVPTPAGPLRGRAVEREGLVAFVLHRHSAGHRVPPHLVGYKAMALGLAALQVRCCLSTAAVGSLRTDWTPGTMAVCTDMLDVTGRRQTLFDHSVKHTPMDPAFLAARWLVAAADGRAKPEACYVCADGPRYGPQPRSARWLRPAGTSLE
jgi:5'-methylthioadenosine phosphorylase